MTELLTAAQMRAVEQAAIASGEVTGLELMERAGRGVVETILEWRPELAITAHRAVVLCGPGNNGGDGFVVARLLNERGWDVEVFLYGDEARLPPDAAENCRRWREMGEVAPLIEGALDGALDRALAHLKERVSYKSGDFQVSLSRDSRHTIFIDALFGTGLSRRLPEDLSGFLGREWLDHCWKNGVAIDIPTGVCSDSGKYLGFAIYVSLTVTFHQPKIGHYMGSWNDDCKDLRVVPLGIDRLDQDTTELVSKAGFELEFSHYHYTKLTSRNKYDFGHAVVLAGGPGKGGAARLAARGALRIGAGLVTVGCPPEATTENAARLDAIMLRPVRNAASFQSLLKDQRINALCLGPGLGVGERTRSLVAAACEAGRSVVIDADALTSFEDDPAVLFGLLRKHCVITPHAGEFRRLFPDLYDRMDPRKPAETAPAFSKVDATRAAAKRAGAIVLFKGADTVIANPKGDCAVNSAHYDRAAPWLATAGSGDVLAGFITGFIARKIRPFDACKLATWLHVECARKFGPGLIAEDLPEQVPAVFRDLGL